MLLYVLGLAFTPAGISGLRRGEGLADGDAKQDGAQTFFGLVEQTLESFGAGLVITLRHAKCSEGPSANVQNSPLTSDQQHACDRLVATAQARVDILATLSPNCVPSRWSVPVLIGPAGSGKAHVCQEVARRLGDLPCERWEIGSWAPAAFRTSGRTRDQLHAFMQRHPEGSVVYLAGVETLINRSGQSWGSYEAAVLEELIEFIDQAAMRSPRFRKQDNNLLHARVLVVVGGYLEPFEVDPTMRNTAGGDWWKYAGQLEHSALPAGLRRRLASCPLVLRACHALGLR